MSKYVALSDEVYNELNALKIESGKSISEVIIGLVNSRNALYKNKKKKRNIMELFGVWKDDAEYWDNFEKEIRKSRNNAKMRDVVL
ncbi:MAG: antitoxin VapB family protein [Nanoarchaeota archaeon]